MVIEASNLIYVSNFNVIGGLETYVYELAKKYHQYDIVVVYNSGHINQINRLKKYVKVIKNEPENRYKVKKCFVNYDRNILPQVEAEEVILLIHAMYKTQGIIPIQDDRIDKVYAVSEAAAKEYSELTGKYVKVVRNPLTMEKVEPSIFLISATRLTPEKGKDRMLKLAEAMDLVGIKYTWLIFTNDTIPINNPNVVYMKPRLDIRPFMAAIKGRGYGVQLSDCEGDCYFTRECESLGVPLIVTPIPSFKEQGLVEGKNCYYMPFNMKDIDINRIRNIPSYEGYTRDDEWKEVLVKKKSKYKGEQIMRFTVEATNKYEESNIYDSELTKAAREKDENAKEVIPKKGFQWEVSEARKNLLVSKGFAIVIEPKKVDIKVNTEEAPIGEIVEQAIKRPKKETAVKKTKKKAK